MGPIQIHMEANDLTVKKVKCQYATILATLVYPRSLMICAKNQLQGILSSGEVEF